MVDANNYLKFQFIDKAAGLSKPIFDEKYGRAGQPVLITDITNHWAAMKLWSFQYLKDNFGEKKWNAIRNVNGETISRQFTLGEYIDYIHQYEDAPPFYLTNCKVHLGTAMQQHYSPPDYFDCWYAKIPPDKRKHTLSWLYIGGKDTFSSLHLDIWDTSAWNCVVTGKKLWLFFDKLQEGFLYNGDVNPFNPDFEKFPAFMKATPLVCIQNPGEVVYTPSNWWHAVYNLEEGISITENFINDINYQQVLLHFRNRQMPKSYTTMKNIVVEHIGPDISLPDYII